MRSFSTYLNESQIQDIVCLSGQVIRQFLNEGAKDPVYDGAYAQILSQFERTPDLYSDTALVAYGADIEKAINHPVRIEVRRRLDGEGAAQVAARGICGTHRDACIESFKKHDLFQSGQVEVKKSGQQSFEFNVAGVDKVLPIKYLIKNFTSVLQRMRYTPGTHVDARVTQTVFVADGDGTMYAKPQMGHLPVLQDSTAYEPLCEYLHLGGIFILVSGNSLERTVQRVKDLDAHLKGRVLVAANGGADFAIFGEDGELHVLEAYRQDALHLSQDALNFKEADFVYVGDDGASTGNDFVVFQAFGLERSVVVAALGAKETDPWLEDNCVGGFEQGTARLLKEVNTLAQQRHHEPLFSGKHVKKWIQQLQTSA